MIRSYFLRRVILIVAITVLISTLITTGLYTYFSQKSIVESTSQDLMPRARSLARFIASSNDVATSEPMIRVLSEDDLLGAQLSIYDGRGNSMADHIVQTEGDGESPITPNTDMLNLQPYVQEVLTGQEVTASGILDDTSMHYLVLGTPIMQENGVVIGAVMMTKPLQEIQMTLTGINKALFTSMLLVFGSMLLLTFFSFKRALNPMYRVKDIALQFAQGNFEFRADESQRGEWGELAQSLNVLSQSLEHTIFELQLEKMRLTEVLNGLTEGIVAIDKDGNITHANPALKTLFPNNQSDNAYLALIPDLQVWRDMRDAMLENRTISRNIIQRNTILHVNITPFKNDSGELVGAVALISDITESERLEKTRRDYVANVSHELRTPLAAIRALSETLRDGMLSGEEDKQRYYENIVRESQRLSRLVDDLMALSRLQSDASPFAMEPFDLYDVLCSVADSYQAVADSAGIELVIEAEDARTHMAYGNEDRVEQVLIIFLDNAIKFTPRDGHITLKALWQETHFKVSVQDDGQGITEEDLPHVFERFYKADKAHATEGTGLGLSIARETLQRMGESVSVASEAGKGAEFTFTLKGAQDETTGQSA